MSRPRGPWRLRLVRLCLVLVSLAPFAEARAAGLFLAPRGVRPLARGGAFVAGADDVNALSYNPAGLAAARDSVLLDAALTFYSTEYTRTVTADSPALPTVTGEPLYLPSPTLGVVTGFGLVDGLKFGLALMADYPTLQNWPATLEDGAPSPQRYAIINYDGTLILKGAVGAGYSPVPWLRLGTSFQLLFGSFVATNAISVCDGVLCTQPENPEYDATIQMAAEGMVLPGAQVGIQLQPFDWLVFGLAWETGYEVDEPAVIRVRLPTAAAYRNANVDPAEPTGTVAMSLPMELRAGLEVRPSDGLRAELAFVFAPWSVHDSIDANLDDAVIRDIDGLGDYRLASVSVPRGFRDTISLRVGGEYSPLLGEARDLTIRLGLTYETGAVPDNALTAMTVDLDKILIAAGVAYNLGDFALELTYAAALSSTVTVSDSTVRQVNPTRPPFAGATPIGNGTYATSGHLAGLGVSYRW